MTKVAVALKTFVLAATLAVVSPAAIAEEFPIPDVADLRLMVGCSNRYQQATKIEDMVAALHTAALNATFKATLLRVISPYSPIREHVQGIEAEHPDAGGALLHLASNELLRARYRVDRTASDAVGHVIDYHLAQIADGEAGTACGLTDSTRRWMDGMAFAKFAVHPPVDGLEFAQLDVQQAELRLCVAAGSQGPTPQQMATVIGKDAAMRSVMERAARRALTGSSQAPVMDALDRIPANLLAQTGVQSPEGQRVFAILSALWTASVDDPDFPVRLQARLLYVHYQSLATNASCPIPPESQQLIEYLHADH